MLVRSSPTVCSLPVGPLTECFLLYDALLYLPDASDSLMAALDIINRFGGFSGIRINWNKSLLFPLSQQAPLPPSQTPLIWVSKFKYLGIEIQGDLSCYLAENVYPVLQQLTHKCPAWKSLPLSLAGRIHFLKMSFLPKFLYMFRNTPISIPNSFFIKLEWLMTSFIWVGSTPRIAKSTLQLPLSHGGLALPCFRQYYGAAVLVTVRCWFEKPIQPSTWRQLS